MRHRFAAFVGGVAFVACTQPVSAPTLRATGCSASFDEPIARIALGGHHVSIGFGSIGRPGEMHEFANATVTRDGDALTYARDGVTEWWRTTAAGLEHGLTIDQRPSGEGALSLALAIDGLTPRTRDSRSITLVDAHRVVAVYAGLTVIDATGARLPASIAPRDVGVRIDIDDANAVYPIVVDPVLSATQEAEFLPPPGIGDLYGASVALSGDGSRAVVNGRNSTGYYRVQVFVRSGTSWTLEASLAASDGNLEDAVAISADGSRVVVPGRTISTSVYSLFVFVRTGSSWALEATIAASPAVYGPVAIDSTGSRVLATVSVAGALQGIVFARTGTSWGVEAQLAPSDRVSGDVIQSCALSGDGARVLLGVPGRATAAGTWAGAAYVFVRSGTTWSQEAELLAPDGTMNAYFGWSVSLTGDGSRALVGAYLETTSAGSNAGAAYFFVRSGASWSLESEYASTVLGAGLGFSVALSVRGDRAVVGAINEVGGGAAHMFLRAGSAWARDAVLTASDGASGDLFGASVALTDGHRALVGAREHSGTPSGAAYVFSLAGPNGQACVETANCQSGFCVDGVCCNSACGGGAATPGNCMACSAARTGGADGACAALSASLAPTITCRAAIDTCDAPEVCSTSSTACPTDTTRPSTTVCRAPIDLCDAPEMCTGTGTSCPADAIAIGGTLCRAASGPCETAALCDGIHLACPPSGLVPAAAASICRPVAGSCDVAELCNGASAQCPSDGFQAMGTVCNATMNGACDAPDTCSGTSASCPATYAATGTVCHVGMGVCDTTTMCTGTSITCPDHFIHGVVCRAAAGACDIAESCTGGDPNCPPDAVEGSGTVCRASSGSCNPAESCDGVGTGCPPDVNMCVTVPDGATRDASVLIDGSAVDAATAPIPVSGSCGCATSSSHVPMGVWLLLVSATALRRARRRSN